MKASASHDTNSTLCVVDHTLRHIFWWLTMKPPAIGSACTVNSTEYLLFCYWLTLFIVSAVIPLISKACPRARIKRLETASVSAITGSRALGFKHLASLWISQTAVHLNIPSRQIGFAHWHYFQDCQWVCQDLDDCERRFISARAPGNQSR